MVRLSLFSLALLASASLSVATSEVQHLRALQANNQTGGGEGPGGGGEPGGGEGPGGDEEPAAPEDPATPEDTPDDEEDIVVPGDEETMVPVDAVIPMDNTTMATPGPEAQTGAANETGMPEETGVPMDPNATQVPGEMETMTDAPVDGNMTANTTGTEFPMDPNATGVPMDTTVPVVGETQVPVDAESMAPGFDIFTVFELAANETDLSQLNTVLNLSGIPSILPPDANYTVFAPTDDAINSLPPALLTNLLTSAWGAHLENLLAFHVVSGTVFSTDLTDGMVVETLNGEDINIAVGADGVGITSAFTVNASTVVAADLTADNGVIHKIDSVLLPGWTGTGLLSLVNTTAGANFTTLFSLIETMELAELLDMAGLVTVFAPTNAAFEALPNGTLDALLSNNADLTTVLANHVLVGMNPSSLLSDGLKVKGIQGFDLTFSATPEGGFMINDANILFTDVLANNGIVHAIDKVLIEPYMTNDTVVNVTDDAQANTTTAPEPNPMSTPPDEEEPAPPAKAPAAQPLPLAPTANADRSSSATVSMIAVSALAVLVLAMV